MRAPQLVHAVFGLVTMASLVGAQTSVALPLAPVPDFGASNPAPVLSDLEADAVDFTAIVALSNCSGSLVRYTTSNPTDKAMVLTNGHCLEGGFLEPGEVVVGRSSTRTFRLLSSDATRTLATLRATKVLFATMTSTDMTLYGLTQTYAEIKAATGVDALTISPDRPAAGAPSRVVSGYWKKIYNCSVDAFVFQLKEAGWLFKDSIRFKQPGCETIGGSSGSPIVHADTKEVIGVNNTGNEDGSRCTMNNPCEVDEAGNVTATRGAAYGQQTYWLYGCLDESNQINLDTDGCELPKPQ